VALLAVIGSAARGLLGRPWVVEAVDGDGHALRWRVKGWRASTERCREIANLLATGITPPDHEVLPPTSLPSPTTTDCVFPVSGARGPW
jgi:hypothetical protein